MCEESLSSLFFACNCEAQAIAPLLERQERQENPPKGFSRSDKCLPVSGIFRRKNPLTGKHLSPLLVAYKKKLSYREKFFLFFILVHFK